VPHSASRPTMSQPDDGRSAVSLRRSWPLAACVQFLRVFQAPLRLKSHPSGDVLERMLVDPARHPTASATILGRLANVQGRKTDEWERALRRRVDEKWSESFDRHPMDGCEWEQLEPEQRLDIVHALCEWLCQDDPDIIDALERTVSDKEYTADALREEPIGVDAEGSRYYYLGIDGEDCRLYKETPPKNRGERRFIYDNAEFSTVCTTLEELAELKDKFASSNQKTDLSLAKTLMDDIIPKLEETKAARERAIRKAERIEQMPRKRSGRLQLLQIQREDEERQREIEEAQQRERQELERARKQEEQRLRKLHAREERARSRVVKQQANDRLITGEKVGIGRSREERMKEREAKFMGEDDEQLQQIAPASAPRPFESEATVQADEVNQLYLDHENVPEYEGQEARGPHTTWDQPPSLVARSENHALHADPAVDSIHHTTYQATHALAKQQEFKGSDMDKDVFRSPLTMEKNQDPPLHSNGHCQPSYQS